MNTSAPTSCHPAGSMPHCEAAVEWLPVDCGKLPARAAVARFHGNGGVTECHVTIQLTHPVGLPLATLNLAWQQALATAGINPSSTIFRRVFCSDVPNQATSVCRRMSGAPGAVSIIGQPPLPAAKLALWSQHLIDPRAPNDITCDGTACQLRRGALTHHWITGLTAPSNDNSHTQTTAVLANHEAWLAANGMTLADHVVRTWWFVRNIDADYQGLVDARRDHFHQHGLTPDTHYIASTGIAGASADLKASLSLDSHAIAGLRPAQTTYLHAPDHLCPTHDYGVTFERATAITYADRQHIYLSGTASIDRDGRIVHEGDVVRQLDRTLENIEALLATAGANTGDLAAILVYLRDPADGALINQALNKRLGPLPFILLHAPVCRPGWLIEIEGIAIASCNRPDLPEF